MIQIVVKNEMYAYDVYHITKAFFPNETVEQTVKEELLPLVSVSDEDGFLETFEILEEGLSFSDRKRKKQQVSLRLYDWLAAKTGRKPAWGTLTGVRPTKLLMNLLETGKTEEEAVTWMQEQYRVTKEKSILGLEVAKREKALLEQLDYENGYSLYIGIPFCPSICSYCSFSSYPLASWKTRVEDYLDALCRELAFIGQTAAAKNKKLNTVYIGGGTPTTLEPEQLHRLLSCVESHFSYEDLKEFTVEAGRPDSITREKLNVLKTHGIGRISVNPQTMQQKTLDAIGRRHTVEDVKRVYAMARELGFDNINMDLIAGLPGETKEDMQDTLEQIKKLAPDSLTVHALAIKRASRMTRENCAVQMGSALTQMIELASSYAKNMGLYPYYLYRQKNIAGNFENVGYAKVDKAGIYNILIMEEKQSILAVGAGASTKLVIPEEQAETDEKTGKKKTIVRIENTKDVSQYIRHTDEMIARKGEWLWR